MFIPSAYAQAASGPGSAGAFNPIMLAPYVLIFIIFYFLLIRPQQKRAAAQRDLIGAVKRGDEVVTGGGLIGKATKVSDAEVEVELAPNVRVRVVKSMLADVRAKGAPTPANDAKA